MENSQHNEQSSHSFDSFSRFENNPESLRPNFLELTRNEQRAAVEALLFASEEPLSVQNLYDLLVSGEEGEKKPSGKAHSNNKNGLLKNGALNGHHANGAIPFSADGNKNRDTDIEETAHTPSSTNELNNIAPTIAFFRAEPPEGILSEELTIEESTFIADETIPSNSTEPSQENKASTLIGELIAEINNEFEATGRVFRIVEVALEGMKGFQFATKPEFGELLSRLVKSKAKKRLSKAALETLAIIAYRQPISKPELEVIRGVSSNEIMNRLLEKNLITIVGRSESVGKPSLYGTTDDFLRLFGLHSIADLPKPRELEELMAEIAGERSDIAEVVQTLSEADIRKITAIQGQPPSHTPLNHDEKKNASAALDSANDKDAMQ